MKPTLSVVLSAAILLLAACGTPPPAPPAAVAEAAPAPAHPPLSGERLIYLVGCVSCHHQTPKDVFNAPPLSIVQSYSLDEFTTLLRTGVTRGGRDMYAEGSIMGIIAREQFTRLTPEEVAAIHGYLQHGWTAERAAAEEAKIAQFPPPTYDNH